MTTVVVGVDTYPANFLEIADGEAVSQASRTTVIQPYADASTFLRNRAAPSAGFRVPMVMAQPAWAGASTFATAHWTFNDTNNTWVDSGGGVAGGQTAKWSVVFPFIAVGGANAWRIDSMTAWTINVTGHGGSGPAVAQVCSLHYVDPNDAAGRTLVSTITDPSAAAVLDTLHSFGIGSIAHSLRDGAQYWLEFTAENGANAQPDTEIHAVYFDLLPA